MPTETLSPSTSWTFPLSLNTASGASKKKKASKGIPETFIRKKSVKQAGFTMASALRKKEVLGDIGIEIECESQTSRLPQKDGGPNGVFMPELIPEMWQYHHDGSLRGYDNAEYVLKKPLKFEEVPGAVNALWDMFKKAGAVLADSNRTSVHIHLNAHRFHLNRLCAFAALYFSVEEILTEWCGDHRVGNLFCLRGKDAPAIVSKLKAFIQEDCRNPINEGLHYGGLNIHALTKFGSIEVRALRGCTDPETILTWVSILERIYKLSGDFPDPRNICDNFSGEGPMAYLQMVLGDKTSIVKEGISFTNQRIMESLYEGIRLAQDLCYCRDWSLYEPIDVAPDPFDRDITQILGSLTAATPSGVSEQELMNIYLSATANQLATPITPQPAEEYDPEDVEEWFDAPDYVEYDEDGNAI